MQEACWCLLPFDWELNRTLDSRCCVPLFPWILRNQTWNGCRSVQAALNQPNVPCRNPQSASHGKPPLGPPQQGRARGRSYVPHHVRFPDQYTAYVLDEPITVGGGDWSSADNGSSELLKVSLLRQTWQLLNIHVCIFRPL